ncbi:MAG TPA: hypothetical protein VHY79_17615 [Rhizomicrobium sp.]|jgi:hypothetical protein|nr:hypothetical protein [Rhizomicrobium sp.]
MHRYVGGCHCGNLCFIFDGSAPLETLGLRADQCSFCRAHGARNTSDPNGSIAISVRDSSALIRYRFGLRTADFLICARCGVYIGALMDDGGSSWFTINVNTFRPPPPDDFPIVAADYEREDVPARVARRKQRWTPVGAFAVHDV